MLKKIGLLIVSASLLSGCTDSIVEVKEVAPEQIKPLNYGQIKVVNTVEVQDYYGSDTFDILQDTNTGCLYFTDRSGYGDSISPLYDNEGNVQGCYNVYQKEE